jgi:hypothetical protein
MPLIKKGKRSTGRAGIDGLPQPVEYQHRLIEQCIHDLVTDKFNKVSRIGKLLSMNPV